MDCSPPGSSAYGDSPSKNIGVADSLPSETPGKTMKNLKSILRSRDITLLIQFCMVNAVVFQVVKYGCDSWAIEKAEH